MAMAHPSNLLVTVRPSQSAFFAGEPFSCTVTFTNLAPPAPVPASAPAVVAGGGFSPLGASITDKRRSLGYQKGGAGPRYPGAEELGPGTTGFTRGHRSALSLSQNSGLGLASGRQPPVDEPEDEGPTTPTSSSPFPDGAPSPSPGYPGGIPSPAGSMLDSPGFPQPRQPSPSGSGSKSKGSKPLPTRQGLIGRPIVQPDLLAAGSPPFGRRKPSHQRGQSVSTGLGLRSASNPDLGSAAAQVPVPPLERKSSGEGYFGTVSGGPSPVYSRKPSLAGRGVARKLGHLLTGISKLKRGAVPASIAEEDPDPAAVASSIAQISLTAPTPDPSSDVPSFTGSSTPYSPSVGVSPAGSTSNLSSTIDHPRSGSFYTLGSSANETMDSVLREEVGDWAVGNGGPSGTAARRFVTPHRRASSMSVQSDLSAASAPPGLQPPANLVPRRLKSGRSGESTTELLLWTFAKLEAHFEVDERLIKPTEFQDVKKALFGKTGAGAAGGVGAGGGMFGAGAGAVGGGTLEGTEEPPRTGWRGWLFGSGGGSGSPAGPSDGGGNMGSPTARTYSPGVGGTGTLEQRRNKAMQDKAVPMFSTPPSVVAVDLKLAPGESRNYTFTIGIPADLPPSFKGKSIKFQYNFVVGTNRAPPTSSLLASPAFSGVAPGKQISRVMKVPVRVYNNVSVTGARPFYDLTNPIIYARDEAVTACPDEPPVPITRRRASTLTRATAGQAEMQSYAGRLLDALASTTPELVNELDALSPSAKFHSAFQDQRSPPLDHGPHQRPEMRARHTSGSDFSGGALASTTAAGGAVDEEEEGGCKGAVEVVTRSSPKMSFDINKDGSTVAQLTLIKSAFRLGESVDGVVVVNSGADGAGRVLRYSARLETHELVETTIATRPAAQVQQATRRLHAEHHEATLDTGRAGFSLAVPSGASPDFSTSGVKLQWSVRLTLLFVPPSKYPVTITPKTGSHARSGSVSGGGAASASAGSGQGFTPSHGRSKSYAYGFEPQVAVPPSFVPIGSPHLLPVQNPGDDSAALHTVYRGVPDLSYVPILYGTTTVSPETARVGLPPTSNESSSKLRIPLPSSPPLPGFGKGPAPPQVTGNVVLIPAKVETVECSIPIRVYPGNTPFTPAITTFFA